MTAVVFDVGETLVDETRYWEAIADAVEVPRLTFLGVLGGVIERGEPQGAVLEILDVARPERLPPLSPDDIYPDALPCLAELRSLGYALGLAGNQPASTEVFLRDAGFDVDFVASSQTWGVEKPSLVFFEHVAAEAGRLPEQIAYVGDRLDNDVLPAKAAGMVAVFLRRGPWGYLHALRPEAEEADVRINSLEQLVEALAGV
ncbi:MAG: HAD family hydrolase [Gaiellaceae bacterium]